MFCAEHIRSDNGPEFVAKELRKWLAYVGTGTLYIEPGSPWENGYCESFHGKLRDECLNGEIFYSLKEAQIVIEKWRVEYNTRGPHSALGFSKLGFTMAVMIGPGVLIHSES
jgi:putative transposase